jgi:plastocyanin
MRFHGSLMILALFVCDAARGAALHPVPDGCPCEVHGHIEILNPRVTLPNGKGDSGNVVLWLTPADGTTRQDDALGQKRILEQRNNRFVPHVMAIEVGTEVDFPNHDSFFHNVFSLYDGKPFDLGLYANGESRSVSFDRPGISFIFCSIHPRMSAVIVTVPTPYFAVSSAEGRYSMRNVPMGTYDLRLWHERSDQQQILEGARTVTLDSPVVDLGTIPLDEAGYVARTHLDTHSLERHNNCDVPADRRP